MSDLLAPGDPDVAAFTDGDSAFFLRAAGEAVRRHCGWHITPVLTETVTRPIGSGGLVMLPTTRIATVESMTVQGDSLAVDVDYRVDRRGWLELPGRCRGYATVTFTHGFQQLPVDVKTVVLELATNAADTTHSTATQVGVPGYTVTFSDNVGLTLTGSMRERLAPYRASG